MRCKVRGPVQAFPYIVMTAELRRATTARSAVVLIEVLRVIRQREKRAAGSGAVSFAAVDDVHDRHDAALSSMR